MTLAPAKDPQKVKAGQAGMRSRWGPPRIARLDTLSPPVRAAVLALIAADEAAKEMTAPDVSKTSSEAVEEMRRGSDTAS